MENKFNFNSQVCTSRSQSERLLALGLKKETADMIHVDYGGRNYIIRPYDWLPTSKVDMEKYIPAWSLHRLIEMMPMSLVEDKVYHEYWDLNVTPIAVIYRNQDDPSEWIGECMGQGMYDNIIHCIEWLIKEGYFSKEYLEE